MVLSFLGKVLFAVLDLYFELQCVEYTDLQVEELEQSLIPAVLESVTALNGLRQKLANSSGRFSGIKLHLVTHIPYFIRLFGAPRCWNTSSFESANKTVKRFYRTGRKHTSSLEVDTLRQVTPLKISKRSWQI